MVAAEAEAEAEVDKYNILITTINIYCITHMILKC